MSDKFVLDKAIGRQTDMHFDQTDNTFRFNTHQDVTPILEDNKRKFNEYGDKLSMGKRGEWHHVSSVPTATWEKWMRESNGEISRDPKVLAAYLNDPDYKYFKVAPTKI
jgi:hypothetical protein